MNCKVTFKNGDGTEIAAGNLIFERENFRLFYSLDGDSCLLTCENNIVLQTRRGSLNTDITFKEGENTLCRIAGEGSVGEIEVFTRKITVIQGSAGINLKLFYDLGGEEMTLEITALINPKPSP